MRARDPKVVVLMVVGVLALAGAGWFGYLTVRGRAPADTAAAAPLPTRRVASKAGGFTVRVPQDMTVARAGRSIRLTARSKDLVVSVGPIDAGPLPAATRAFLGTVRAGYSKVTVLGHRREHVDGHPARTTFGQVRQGGSTLRFVVVTVHARPRRNYALTAFTAHDSDPTVVLPRVDAIVGSFRTRS